MGAPFRETYSLFKLQTELSSVEDADVRVKYERMRRIATTFENKLWAHSFIAQEYERRRLYEEADFASHCLLATLRSGKCKDLTNVRSTVYEQLFGALAQSKMVRKDDKWRQFMETVLDCLPWEWGLWDLYLHLESDPVRLVGVYRQAEACVENLCNENLQAFRDKWEAAAFDAEMTILAMEKLKL